MSWVGDTLEFSDGGDTWRWVRDDELASEVVVYRNGVKVFTAKMDGPDSTLVSIKVIEPDDGHWIEGDTAGTVTGTSGDECDDPDPEEPGCPDPEFQGPCDHHWEAAGDHFFDGMGSLKDALEVNLIQQWWKKRFRPKIDIRDALDAVESFKAATDSVKDGFECTFGGQSQD